jgi:hypothetical protein
MGYNMFRTLLQQKFYSNPTRQNLEELLRCLREAEMKQLMTKADIDHVREKAEEYYNDRLRDL